MMTRCDTLDVIIFIDPVPLDSLLSNSPPPAFSAIFGHAAAVYEKVFFELDVH